MKTQTSIRPKIKQLILTPAHGKDAKTDNEVLKLWDNNFDFEIQNPDSELSYICKKQFIEFRKGFSSDVQYIHFRFNGLKKRRVIKPENY